MNRKWYLLLFVAPLLFLLFLKAETVSDKSFVQTKEITRIRNIGHLVLKSSADSVSIVLPVEKISGGGYKLKFQRAFTPNPDSIFLISMQQLKERGEFAVELWESGANKMIYSFVVSGNNSQTVLPCLSRPLTLNNYEIIIRFARADTKNNSILAASIALLLLAAGFIIYKVRFSKPLILDETDTSYTAIGEMKFYSDKQKIILGTVVTELTGKETEILALLSQTPNTVVERSRLQKEIWEDQGIIVTRSLDIFISRLRKKLSIDSTVKIVNVHGKGYKLEIANGKENT